MFTFKYLYSIDYLLLMVELSDSLLNIFDIEDFLEIISSFIKIQVKLIANHLKQTFTSYYYVFIL